MGEGEVGGGIRDCQGVGEPGPLVLAHKNGHPSRDQALEDERRRIIKRVGRVNYTRDTEVSKTDNPPVADRYLGAFQGWKGVRTDAGHGGRIINVAWGTDTGGGVWKMMGVL